MSSSTPDPDFELIRVAGLAKLSRVHYRIVDQASTTRKHLRVDSGSGQERLNSTCRRLIGTLCRRCHDNRYSHNQQLPLKAFALRAPTQWTKPTNSWSLQSNAASTTCFYSKSWLLPIQSLVELVVTTLISKSS